MAARRSPRTQCYRVSRGAASVVAMAVVALPSHTLSRDGDLEAAIKANYLYKFTPFITWPSSAFSSATSPFNLCVLDPDPFGEILDAAVRNQQVAGHSVVVRRLVRPEGLLACQLIYMGAARDLVPTDVLQSVARKPVLTVTEEGSGAPGIIRFVRVQGRVRFTVDAGAAQSAGLMVSSKLLALAVARADTRP